MAAEKNNFSEHGLFFESFDKVSQIAHFYDSHGTLRLSFFLRGNMSERESQTSMVLCRQRILSSLTKKPQ